VKKRWGVALFALFTYFASPANAELNINWQGFPSKFNKTKIESIIHKTAKAYNDNTYIDKPLDILNDKTFTLDVVFKKLEGGAARNYAEFVFHRLCIH